MEKTREIVFFKDGKEVEWIDPIVDITITDERIDVDNGRSQYTYINENGLWYEISNPSKKFDSYKVGDMPYGL